MNLKKNVIQIYATQISEDNQIEAMIISAEIDFFAKIDGGKFLFIIFLSSYQRINEYIFFILEWFIIFKGKIDGVNSFFR